MIPSNCDGNMRYWYSGPNDISFNLNFMYISFGSLKVCFCHVFYISFIISSFYYRVFLFIMLFISRINLTISCLNPKLLWLYSISSCVNSIIQVELKTSAIVYRLNNEFAGTVHYGIYKHKFRLHAIWKFM